MKIEVDHIKLAKTISRGIFMGQPMITKVVKSKKWKTHRKYIFKKLNTDES